MAMASLLRCFVQCNLYQRCTSFIHNASSYKCTVVANKRVAMWIFIFTDENDPSTSDEESDHRVSMILCKHALSKGN